MQDIFEKIIEKLNSKKTYFQGFYECEGKTEHDSDLNKATQLALDDAIEIVKQEAEQYEECYKYCGDCEAYNKEKHHCPKFCKVIKETVKEIEENHNGWIPCSERLPETSGEYLTWVKYDGKEFHSIDEIDCDGIFKEWNCSSDYKIIAWMHLPTQYQPNGE